MGYLFLGLAVLCIAGTAFFSRLGVSQGASPGRLALVLFSVSTVIGWGLVFLRGAWCSGSELAVAGNAVFAGVGGALGVALFAAALRRGPFAYSNAIYRCSFIVPIAFGVCVGSLTLDNYSLGALGLTIAGIVLMSQSGAYSKVGWDGRWVFFVMAAFVTGGLPRIAQMRIAAAHSDIEAYLRMSFLMGALALALLWAVNRKSAFFTGNHLAAWGFGSLAAGTSFTGGYATLRALGELPAQIVFPVSLCTPIVLGLLLGMVFFGERISRAGWVGITCTAAGLAWLAMR